jgi:hypothetical protein
MTQHLLLLQRQRAIPNAKILVLLARTPSILFACSFFLKAGRAGESIVPVNVQPSANVTYKDPVPPLGSTPTLSIRSSARDLSSI